MSVSFEDVEAAASRISPYIHLTDITQMPLPGKKDKLFIKTENLQVTGSFKVRGAFNRILQLTEDEKSKGVLAASAGNHAQGVALAAQTLEIPCTIVMPRTAPLSKIAATESYGAKVVLFGEVYDDAFNHALEIQEKTGATFVHPFDDEAVIAGQGTIGLEILRQLPKVEQVVVPIGGGGLAAGIALTVKTANPSIKVIGVEPKNAASMLASFKSRHPVTLASATTIADGIAVKTPGNLTYGICCKNIDEIVTVEDDDIANTILYLLEKTKIVSEGAGAATVAAALMGKIALNVPTVAVLSGGNIDVTVVARIIDKGLLKAGRKFILFTLVADRPGQLAALLALVSGTGANVVMINHDRLAPFAPIGSTMIKLELETRDRQHVYEIRSLLEDNGYKIINEIG